MDAAETPVGVQMAKADAADATGFGFWRLPLGDCVELEDAESSRPDSPVDYWRLPLSLDLDEIELQEKEAAGRDEKHVTEETAATAPGVDRLEQAGELNESIEAEASPISKPQNKTQEINDMLDRCRVERGEFDKNLRELEEVQMRLKALVSRAQKQEFEVSLTKRQEGVSSGKAATELVERGTLPSEVLSFVMWCLDFESLARAGTVCSEWNQFSRSEDRWIRLLATDWGVYATPPAPLPPVTPSSRSKSGPSSPQSRALPAAVQDYRHCLNRFRQMHSTLASLNTSGISAVCGSLARKRVFEALELLVDLGSSRDQKSFYPSQVPELLHKLGSWRSLLVLLDDESPHLQWLSVRSLADLVGSEAAQTEPPQSAGGLPVLAAPGTSVRLLVREEIVRRGALIRELLEGDDIDLVESSARLMLNLHSSFPGTPLGASMRGPYGVLQAQGFCKSDFSGSPSSSSLAAAEIWAQAWSGVWIGEMCYARGGEKHADLRLILGLQGDPAVDRGSEALRAAAGLTDAQHDEEPEEASSSSGRRSVRTSPSAQYWHYFGFLANSDFDGPVDTVRYIDEQMRKRRQQPASPSQSNSGTLGKDLKLVGVGWDEQNGLFTAEAQLPKMPTVSALRSRGRSGVLGADLESGAVPLRLKLRYDRSWSSYELTAFLTDGRAGEASKGARVPAMFGVWATAPSQHKHLFVLRRTGTLESVV